VYAACVNSAAARVSKDEATEMENVFSRTGSTPTLPTRCG
jgi:hypothetical protein